jgi:hypothetical protein
MTQFDLTAAEFTAAKHLVQSCLNGMGGDRPADLADDEYTWIDIQDLMAHDYSRHEAAGFFSSLASKGFIFEYDAGEWIVLTEAWKWMDTKWEQK